MPYVQPQDVSSPQKEMTLDRVLIDPGAAREPAYALQLWHKPNHRPEFAIGTRWNGDDERENGTPNISGHACWFVLDRALWPGVLAMIANTTLRDYAVGKLYGNGNGLQPGNVALDAEE